MLTIVRHSDYATKDEKLTQEHLIQDVPNPIKIINFASTQPFPAVIVRY